jgi:hypothetical protein
LKALSSNPSTEEKKKKSSIKNLLQQKTHEKMLTISSHKGNANQNHTKIPPHPCRIASTTDVGEDVGKKMNPRTLLVGKQTSTTTLEKNWRHLKNLNIDLSTI